MPTARNSSPLPVKRIWGRITIASLLTIVLWLGLTAGISAETLLFNVPEKGSRLFQANDYNGAAGIWLAESRKMLTNGDILSKKRAGLLHVMATIAFEKQGSTEAYAAWSDAIRYFLESRTTWQEVQIELRRTFNNLQLSLQTATPSPVVNVPSKEENLWLWLIENLQLTTYNGPAPGLIQREARMQQRVEAHQQRYLPRPFGVPKASAPTGSPQAGGLPRGLSPGGEPVAADTAPQ